jgi:phage tail-like protein
MRGLAAPARDDEPFELVNPHPLWKALPGVYQDAWLDERLRYPGDEPFGTRFLGAFDAVLAPIIATLDNLDSYLDPDTTPEDFLSWLGEWVAASVDETWDPARRRAFVAQAAELYRRRGTAAGLMEQVRIHTGGTVEVAENGASAWSVTPDAKLPGSPEPVVLVTVIVEDPKAVDQAKLESLVRAAKPAHLVQRIEIVDAASRGAKKRTRSTSEAGEAPTT